MNENVLGYRNDGTPITPTPKGSIVTKAFIICYVCKGVIKTTGGPGQNSYCVKCWEKYSERTN